MEAMANQSWADLALFTTQYDISNLGFDERGQYLGLNGIHPFASMVSTYPMLDPVAHNVPLMVGLSLTVEKTATFCFI